MKVSVRNRLVVLAALIASFALPTTASAGQAKAELSSFNSVPALATPGEGVATAKLKRSEGRIEYRLYYSGIESGVRASHIHFGNAWENGGIIAYLCTNLGDAPAPDVPACPQASGTVEGVIEADDVVGPGGDNIQPGDFATLLDAIDAGAVYVNIHTEAHPKGEIRGQLD